MSSDGTHDNPFSIVREEKPRTIFKLAEIPEHLRPFAGGVPNVEPDVALTKSRAKSVAEELTGRRVQAFDKTGCVLRIHFPSGPRDYTAASWWLCCRKLVAELTRRGMMPESKKKFWCKSHEREATHELNGKPCCDPSLGGILLPCRCVELSERLEPKETT